MKAPVCPACGCQSVVAEIESSQFRCPDCDHHFLEGTPDGWRSLLLSMLPLPVVETQHGLVGGNPGEVVVRVGDETVEVAAYRAELRGGEPVVTAKKWKVFDLSAGPSEVMAAIQKARARRLRTYRWCVGCRKVLPPERMRDSVTCHHCADQ